MDLSDVSRSRRFLSASRHGEARNCLETPPLRRVAKPWRALACSVGGEIGDLLIPRLRDSKPPTGIKKEARAWGRVSPWGNPNLSEISGATGGKSTKARCEGTAANKENGEKG